MNLNYVSRLKNPLTAVKFTKTHFCNLLYPSKHLNFIHIKYKLRLNFDSDDDFNELLEEVPNSKEIIEEIERSNFNVIEESRSKLKKLFDEDELLFKNLTEKISYLRQQKNVSYSAIDEIIESMDVSHLSRELRNMGYRSSGDKIILQNRLKEAVRQGHRHDRLQKIKIFTESVPEGIENEEQRRKIMNYHYMKEKLEKPINTNSFEEISERLSILSEFSEHEADPVGSLDLDSDYSRENINISNEELDKINSLDSTFSYNKSIWDYNDLDLFDSIEKSSSIINNEITTEKESGDKKRKFMERKGGGFINLTIIEAAELLGIPKEFIGEYICNCGAIPAIPLDVPLRDLIDPKYLYDFFFEVQKCDPNQIKQDYTPFTIKDLAEEYNFSLDDILKACEKLHIQNTVPFGYESLLSCKTYSKLTMHLMTLNNNPMKN